jgi:hypothetical protein
LALLVQHKTLCDEPLGAFFCHKTLQDPSLIAAKKRNHIGPLKDKQRLVNAQQKTAGNELAAGQISTENHRRRPSHQFRCRRLYDFSPGYLLPPLMARTTAISNIAPTTAVIRAPHIPLLGIFSNPNTYPPM